MGVLNHLLTGFRRCVVGGVVSYVDSGMSNPRKRLRRRERSTPYPGKSAAGFTRRRSLSECYPCNSFAAIAR